MKHLKKFNEELKPSTYLSASRKLKKLGHERRFDKAESTFENIISQARSGLDLQVAR